RRLRGLRRCEGWHRDVHAGAGPGAGPRGHHRQLHRAGLHRDRTHGPDVRVVGKRRAARLRRAAPPRHPRGLCRGARVPGHGSRLLCHRHDHPRGRRSHLRDEPRACTDLRPLTARILTEEDLMTTALTPGSTGAQGVAHVIAGLDRPLVFGLPGGHTVEVFDALRDHAESVEAVLVREESLGTVMAEAYGRLAGSPAIVIAQGAWILGAGGIGVMEAHLGASPMVILLDATEG